MRRTQRSYAYILSSLLLWSFFPSPRVPWAQFIWTKHYRLRPPSTTGKEPSGCSPIWKDMMKLSAPFFTSVGFELGNGNSANFWSARWNGDFALRNRFPNLFAVSAARKASVSTWLRNFASSPWAAFPLPLTSVQHNELNLLSDSLESCELSSSPDLIIWRWSSNGAFSTRSAYQFLTDSGIKDGKINFLWTSKAPLRVKLFLWLAAKNRLLTADNLAKRGWQGPSVCLLCCRSEETLQHIIFDCTYALLLWSRFFNVSGTNNRQRLAPSGDLTLRWQHLRASRSSNDRSLLDIVFAAICWELWKERNARIFTNRQASIGVLEGRVKAMVNLWVLMVRRK